MKGSSESYRRFLDGDETGFVEIVRDHRDGLMLYLNSFVNDLSVAEELTEDTFVKLGTKKPRDNGRASFKTWLYTIGRNMAIDHIRRSRKNVTVPLDDVAETADAARLEEEYIKRSDRAALHKAMQSLKPEYRQALWLIYFEGFSAKEAAAIMKKSAHSVETLVYRARQALKNRIDMGGSYEDL